MERERTANVGVEDEKAVRTTFENGIAEMVEAASGSESLVFPQVFDRDLRVGARAILDEVAEDGFVVVANDEDLTDLGDFGDGGEAVRDDRVSGDLEERL